MQQGRSIQGMKVKLRSQEKCRDCGLIFKDENKFHCSEHDRWARRVFVSVSGLTNYRDGRERIFTDKDNIPLSIEAGIKLKDDIVESIKNETFNVKRYLPRSRQVFLFANYKKEYLKKMNGEPLLTRKIKGGYLQDTSPVFRQLLIITFTFLTIMTFKKY